jgi:hypothetical protein
LVGWGVHTNCKTDRPTTNNKNASPLFPPPPTDDKPKSFFLWPEKGLYYY